MSDLLINPFWFAAAATAVPSDLFPGAPLANQNKSAAATTWANVSPVADAATPYVFGAWVELEASLPAAVAGLSVNVINDIFTNTVDTSTLLEIGTGAAAAETMWCRMLLGNHTSAAGWYRTVMGHIDSGTRVSVRVMSAVLSKSPQLKVTFFPVKASADFGTPQCYGFNTGTAGGVALTAPTANNTMGAWTEITASTSADIAALSVFTDFGGDTAMEGEPRQIDIGVGGAGAEVVVVNYLTEDTSTTEYLITRTPVCYGVDIPAGSRIAARWQSTTLAGRGDGISLALVGTAGTA